MNLDKQEAQSTAIEYRTIPLTMGQVAKVDIADFAFLSQWKWHAAWRPKQNRFYACRAESNPHRIILMHRLIMGEPKGLDVDHKDHDTLNNCRHNLRAATRSQNIANTVKLRRNNTSGMRGASIDTRTGKWTARIRIDGSYRFLGYFATKNQAGDAYQVAARKIHGDFLPTDCCRETASADSA